MQTCLVCGSHVSIGSRFCPNCGHVLPSPGEIARVAADEQATPAQGVGVPTTNIGYTPNVLQWQPGQYGQYGPNQAAPQPQPQTPPAQTVQAIQAAYQGGYSQPAAYQPLTATGLQYVAPSGFAVQRADPTVAMLLEWVGYLGFLGIGHMYAGRTSRGVALLLGWFFYGFIAAFLAFSMFGLPIACLMFVAWPVVPILSGFWIKRDLEAERVGIVR